MANIGELTITAASSTILADAGCQAITLDGTHTIQLPKPNRTRPRTISERYDMDVAPDGRPIIRQTIKRVLGDDEIITPPQLGNDELCRYTLELTQDGERIIEETKIVDTTPMDIPIPQWFRNNND